MRKFIKINNALTLVIAFFLLYYTADTYVFAKNLIVPKPPSDFNAPLYNSSDSSSQYKISVDSSVNALINAGFPKDKLVVGVPFYGYLYKVNSNAGNGVYQKFIHGEALSYG